MVSSAKSTPASEMDSEDEEFTIQDERWYDKSSAAYFTSNATRNAQTVSWKQRHRPIFQMYLDLQTGIIVAAIMMTSSVLKLRELNKDPEFIKTENFDFTNVLKGQIVRIFVSSFFFAKFLCFVLWYRCSAKGNIIQSTSSVFWTRNALDVICYVAIAYSIWLEVQVESTEADEGSNAEVFSVKGQEVNSSTPFLGKYFEETNGVMDYHVSHFFLVTLLVLKEVGVYFMCLLRAQSKLVKEEKYGPTTDDFTKAQ